MTKSLNIWPGLSEWPNRLKSEIAVSWGKSGGSDGTRTRGLWRDRQGIPPALSRPIQTNLLKEQALKEQKSERFGGAA